MQTNTKLDSLLSSQALSQADGLIGKTVSFTDSTGATFSGKVAVDLHQQRRLRSRRSKTAPRVAVGPGLTIS